MATIDIKLNVTKRMEKELRTKLIVVIEDNINASVDKLLAEKVLTFKDIKALVPNIEELLDAQVARLIAGIGKALKNDINDLLYDLCNGWDLLDNMYENKETRAIVKAFKTNPGYDIAVKKARKEAKDLAAMDDIIDIKLLRMDAKTLGYKLVKE